MVLSRGFVDGLTLGLLDGRSDSLPQMALSLFLDGQLGSELAGPNGRFCAWALLCGTCVWFCGDGLDLGLADVLTVHSRHTLTCSSYHAALYLSGECHLWLTIGKKLDQMHQLTFK